MSKKPTPSPAPAPIVGKNPREEAPELPVVHSIGMAPAPGGKWVVVELETQGDRVISKAVVSDPDTRAITLHALKLEFAKRMIIPGLKTTVRS